MRPFWGMGEKNGWMLPENAALRKVFRLPERRNGYNRAFYDDE
ncbi:hypothetical protein [Kingella sp. (in: b-proteobacteria)]|nr:hypothetical protein [Kingella sp. (in: b-proteobacteria)]MDO4657821.1 hypothetical protein [Kingella sp. (in: b-proteobacteria)]